MESAIVLHPYLKSHQRGLRDPQARLAEAVGLTEAIRLHIAAVTTALPVAQLIAKNSLRH